ncbi:MAG TPA: anaerobic carbon-monoxide dehydrogenase catalytic subunit [Syntrophorhabdaceae bacterium]|jgi:carbon-monoxide dehydrogenase catalytic subunit|nr:anaerobic carbon-monoxide dehydrogenase catalytic subunit [Syntrophorhabdaceae bacterium]MDI9560586.1 anaerobic carbon-monoxide dehydrogenase catalytic subunit [Pseudomonadota bacterium]HOF57736.1 anaerobic carbon-monoxide dehydrogenase catalytic subunit [Syntrophorhabdaceae bacterium]HOS05055.1 anaerobic carbon-monoxide dehydrogenase catalytic subunit [Syntrophorhabdaceae bacterium]HPL41043.1 anaerobic carbon-monoxide dehydrogenase catalytic subunit [Syntrophorhabdaceae bacterium]
MPEDKTRSIDGATIELFNKAQKENISTVFSRADDMKPCPIGVEESCCKICSMGPCRLPRSKKGEHKDKRGVCGASIDTIVARNFARKVAAGTASHSDHAREVVETFLKTARGETQGFAIKDEIKLFEVALDFGIEVEGKDVREIAIELGEKAFKEFGKQHGELVYVKKAPLKRQEIWKRLGVTPRGIDREIVEIMHRTHMGVDQDYRHILLQTMRCALADGWGGSMISTDLQDIMFGTPVPVLGSINLGVLKEDHVNVIVHGHEPLLPEMLVVAIRDPEIKALTEKSGAVGINLAGMCCSANEVLMRHGIPCAGNFLQQELALVTGAVELMTVDVQCQMQGLQSVAECFHTKLISTSDRAKIEGAEHIEFHPENGLDTAKRILRMAVENYPNRRHNVYIPSYSQDMVAGFSHETINYLLGGIFRASYKPLNENIINGRIRGVAGVVGCNNIRMPHDVGHITMIKELIKNDVIVLTTGCAAMACGKAGLLTPEAAREFSGSGLAEVCEAVGIPPVLHMGSCVDNSRILIAATAMVKEGGLGDDISDLPAAGAAPEWMSEKAIAIGQYFVGSGVFTVFGTTWPTLGSDKVTGHLFNDYKELYKGMWAFEPDPVKAAHLMIEHIDSKRKALGLDKARERVLFDMAMRRAMA